MTENDLIFQLAADIGRRLGTPVHEIELGVWKEICTRTVIEYRATKQINHSLNHGVSLASKWLATKENADDTTS